MIQKAKRVVKRVLGIAEPAPVSQPNPSREKLLKMLPKEAVCAEIGTWKGDLSERFLKDLKPKELHLIDPWLYQTDFGKRLFGGKVAKSQKDMDKIYDEVRARFKAFDDIVHYHRNYSDKASEDFDNEFFDWIYIDGNHYYDYVLKDLELYYPKVKTNGWICGDDYLWTSKELEGDYPVKRAVHDFLKKYEGKVEEHTIMGGQFILTKIA